MDDQERQSLEQELRDERARRRDAERRLEDLTEKAAEWRRRAEERTDRINRMLEQEASKSAVLRRWVRAIRGNVPAETERESQARAESITALDRNPWPRVKSVMVVSAVTDRGQLLALEAFDHRPVDTSDDGDLDRADFIVVDPVAWAGLSESTRSKVTRWAGQPGRQPIVFWASDYPEASEWLPSGPVTMLASESRVARRLGAAFSPGSFDPARHSPLVGPTADATLDLARFVEPDLEAIENAASGLGFTADPGSGAAARRWAYRNHAPWVRAMQLMGSAGISSRNPVPAVGAILVSRRPAAVPASMRAILGQTHRPTELVVGVHGAGVTPEMERISAEADVPVTLLSLSGDLTFGECLNVAASHTTSPLLAKIDDDDHYGPAHLEDSFHALCYSGADIVGKGSHYTYVAGKDTTVLRRPGQEEMFIDGSPNGATLVFRRSVWDEVGFPHRPRHVDTGFLRAARSLGALVYSGSRWEFCYVRGGEGHTWDAEDEVFLAGSEPAWDGFDTGRVEVPDVEAH